MIRTQHIELGSTAQRVSSTATDKDLKASIVVANTGDTTIQLCGGEATSGFPVGPGVEIAIDLAGLDEVWLIGPGVVDVLETGL